MHQSLFTDVCIRRNINLYKYVLLLQYTDFIVPQRVQKLSSLLEDVISRNPNTNSFQFKTATFLRNVNSNECEQKYNNSYASILCNSEKDNIIFEGNVRDAGDAWIINATGMYINDISTAAIYLKKRP
jgi:hypothetical protein